MFCLRRASYRLTSNFVKHHLQDVRWCSFAFDYNYYTKTQTDVPRTSLRFPKDHTEDHIGMWYTLNEKEVTSLYKHGGIPRRFKNLNDIFQETSFMIREPALSVINLIKKSDLSNPPNKFMLYGKNGTGKTLSLAHILHYLSGENWIIVHTSLPPIWLTTFKEIVPSVTREGFFDHTTDASVWLQHFRQQNETSLQNPDLKTTKTYNWTQRDVTEEGVPLLSIVDFGIARSRYASDCIFHLNEELKNYAREGKFKVAVVIDGINSLFSPFSMFKDSSGSYVPVAKFTLIQAFLQMLNTDWKGGAIIGSVDIKMSTKDRRDSYLPRYLLRKKGWETLDPFVPIKVNSYNDKELESAINYYIDRMWLQHPAAGCKEGKEELAFLSGKNPLELEKLSYSR